MPLWAHICLFGFQDIHNPWSQSNLVLSFTQYAILLEYTGCEYGFYFSKGISCCLFEVVHIRNWGKWVFLGKIKLLAHHILPWCQENRCSGSSNALIKVQIINIICHVEQMNGFCQLMCGLPLLLLVVQEVRACSQSYQNCMHVPTKMGGDGRNGENWLLLVRIIYPTLLVGNWNQLCSVLQWNGFWMCE